MLVVDASAASAACVARDGFSVFGDDLVAPPLMWSEVRSGFHLKMIKGEISVVQAETLHERLIAAPVRASSPDGLGQRAWTIANEFGWGRTYDAEYVALAQLLGCRMVTIDMRLRRGTERLGIVVTPGEL
jgi:predicted nucleic acid-binding protein